GTLTVTVRDEGWTRVRNEYVVSAPVGGQLLRIEYKPGADISAGDVLARILPSDPSLLDARSRAELQAAVRSAEAALALARAEVERAEAQLAFAQMEAERVRSLRSADLTSVDAYDRAELQLRVAETNRESAEENTRVREAELAAAEARLLQAGAGQSDDVVVTITSPTSGRVMRVAQESQSVVAGGAEIMTIGDPEDLEVVAQFLSTDAVEVRPGALASIENWGRNRSALRGQVRLVEPYGFLKISALGVEEQRVNVIVDFVGPREEWAVLGHGYRVEVAVVIWEEPGVVQVPVAALFRDGERWAVFRVEDGVAQLTPVSIGRDNGRSAQVLSGLEEGQSVVLYPGEQLTDGARIVERGR
ncbi:MAG TPA: HlyD family efflux transporter periplasmic adaptor subunit, partial [Gammaproteobacteria bacterium]|nr:HlyD family efflux transporter periplasmic adaptor subunit [Gammaproteobacteria bacterium]